MWEATSPCECTCQSYLTTATMHICLIRTSYLSVGTAVHIILWEVPADICCTWIPSRPWTLAGLVIELLLCPWPHWPILLVPQANTSPPKENREETNVIIIHLHNEICWEISTQLDFPLEGNHKT